MGLNSHSGRTRISEVCWITQPAYMHDMGTMPAPCRAMRCSMMTLLMDRRPEPGIFSTLPPDARVQMESALLVDERRPSCWLRSDSQTEIGRSSCRERDGRLV